MIIINLSGVITIFLWMDGAYRLFLKMFWVSMKHNCKVLVTQLPTPRPYSDYIAWLNSQDKSAAIDFWQQYLQGFTAPTPLVVDKTISQSQHTFCGL